MEEETKEIEKTVETAKSETCCHHTCFKSLNGHRVIKFFLTLVIALAIFSVGVSVGSHCGNRSRHQDNFYRTYKITHGENYRSVEHSADQPSGDVIRLEMVEPQATRQIIIDKKGDTITATVPTATTFSTQTKPAILISTSTAPAK